VKNTVFLLKTCDVGFPLIIQSERNTHLSANYGWNELHCWMMTEFCIQII